MMKTFEDASKYGKEMMDNNLKSFAAVTKGFQTIASEAADYSRTSFEKGTETLEKLASAKSLESAVEIQTDYVKTSYESFIAQSTKVGDLVADMAKETYKPFESAIAKAK
jgi:hypothetical protein